MSAPAPSEVYGLTAKQRDLLLIVQELTAIDGVAPTYAEIARELEIVSRSEISRVLDLLRQRGYVDWLPGRRRSIVVRHPIPMPEEPEIIGLFEPTHAGAPA